MLPLIFNECSSLLHVVSSLEEHNSHINWETIIIKMENIVSGVQVIFGASLLWMSHPLQRIMRKLINQTKHEYKII